jgi:hypothetical protein
MRANNLVMCHVPSSFFLNQRRGMGVAFAKARILESLPNDFICVTCLAVEKLLGMVAGAIRSDFASAKLPQS